MCCAGAAGFAQLSSGLLLLDFLAFCAVREGRGHIEPARQDCWVHGALHKHCVHQVDSDSLAFQTLLCNASYC